MADAGLAGASDGLAESAGVGIAVPDTWIDIPIDRREFDRFADRLRRQWRDEAGWDRTAQRHGDVLLANIRHELLQAGVAFSALFLGSPSDDDRAAAEEPPGGLLDGEHDEILMAACTITVHTKESLGTPAELTLGNLTMALGGKHRPGSDDEKRYRRITNLEPAMYHELPVGQSIRLRRLYELRSTGLHPQRFYAESFLIPVGDAVKRCIMAHFVTINLTLARPFSALFEEIAATLTLLDDAPHDGGHGGD